MQRKQSAPKDALPQVSIQQLDYLVSIADAPTWAVAAAELQVSPSALSQGIAELERRLGLVLFERAGRRRVLAPNSGPVLAYARSVVAQTRDLGRWASAQAEAGTGKLRIGMIDAAALFYFSDAVGEYRLQFPDVEVRLTVAPSAQLLEQVQQNELDLAVVVRPQIQPTDLDFVDLVDDPMSVYTSAETVPGDPSTWGPWVSFPASSHTRQHTAEHLRRVGSSYQVVADSNQPEVLCEMVRLGMGWAVLPSVQAESEARKLRRVLDAPLFHRPLIAIQRSNALPHPNADELLRRLAPLD